MFSRFNFQRRHQGFSLIELLLVLGVVALLLVAAFVVYPQVTLAHKVNTEVQNLASVQAGLRSMYGTRSHNYRGLTADVARNAKIFPSRMVNGTEVTNTWGGSIVLGPSANPYSGLAANRTYVIRYRNVPPAACVALVSQAAGYFVAIGVGTESKADGSYAKIVHVLTDAASSGYNKGPHTGVQLDLLTTECNSREASEVMFISS